MKYFFKNEKSGRRLPQGGEGETMSASKVNTAALVGVPKRKTVQILSPSVASHQKSFFRGKAAMRIQKQAANRKKRLEGTRLDILWS